MGRRAARGRQKRFTDAFRAEGWLYLAIVLDFYSRRMIGGAVSNRLNKDLAVSALERAMAITRPPAEVIHYLDRGSQYCSDKY